MSQRNFVMACALLGLASGQVLAAMNGSVYISKPYESREPHEIYQIPKPDSTCKMLPIEQRANCVVVRIGSGAPKSGGIAHLGQDNEMGAQLAVNEINARGDLVLGGKKVILELIGEDDGGDAKQGTVVSQKLVDSGVVAVVGHLNSGVSMYANSTYANAGIVQVSPSSTNPDYTIKGKRSPEGSVTAYRVVGNDIRQGQGIGKWLLKKGAKKVAVLDDATKYGKGLADYTESELEGGGVSVVGRESFTDKTTDFRAALKKLKAIKPDYIMWGGMDDTAASLAKQMKQLGMKAKLVAGDGACTDKFIEMAGNSGEGMVCSQTGQPVGSLKGGAAFMQNYEQTFPGKRVEIYAPYAYDAVYSIVEAMKIADSYESEKIAVAMQQVDFNGLTGRVRFDERGDVVNGAVTMQQVIRQQLKVIDVIQD